MEKKIYFIRHGQTYWNKRRKMQGQVNIPLNNQGRKQAVSAHWKVKSIPIEICYTSPLIRARETASIVLRGKNIKILDEPLLMEQRYGILEGASQIVGFNNPFSPLYNYLKKPEKYKPSVGGESYQQLFERADVFVNVVLFPALEQYDNILISAHGAIIAAVLCQLFGLQIKDFMKMAIRNCEIKCIKYENGRFYE